jgi:peptide/nickel transport system substrate-binding protein
MRQHPVGTGPFKFVEFKPNEYIKVSRIQITGSPTGPISTGSSNTPSCGKLARATWLSSMPVNPAAPPFDNPELRRAMGLAFGRQAFLDILSEGKGAIGRNMMPPPSGALGMPPVVLQTLPGYGPDVKKNRAEAGKIMEELGYGPDKPRDQSIDAQLSGLA